jgi:ferredoxin
MFRISMSKESFACDPEVTVLQAARNQMIKIPYGCASGGCGMCKCKVTDGDYRMELYSKQALTNIEVENHYVLLCKTYPQSDLRVELIREKVK